MSNIYTPQLKATFRKEMLADSVKIKFPLKFDFLPN